MESRVKWLTKSEWVILVHAALNSIWGILLYKLYVVGKSEMMQVLDIYPYGETHVYVAE